MVETIFGAMVGFIGAAVGLPIFFGLLRGLGVYTTVQERTCRVYVLFGSVVAVLEEPGLHFGLRTMQRRMEEIGGGLDVSNFRPHGVCLHVDAATPLNLEVLHNDALPVVVWTVDSPVRIRELLEAGVAGIITNRPRVAAEVRREVLGA